MCDWMLPLMLHNTVFSLDVATVRRGRMSTVNVFFYRTSFQSSSNFISAAAAADNKTATGGAATLQRLSKLGSANGR